MFYALPVLPPVTEVNIERKEYINSNIQLFSIGKKNRERLGLIYFMQTHTFNILADRNSNTKWGKNYATQAWINYNTYLRYNK